METDLSPELEYLVQEIDEQVTARGWATTGYFFDDSPLVGVHLAKNEDYWELYWRDPRGSLILKRFVNVSDAYPEMIKAIIFMKQGQSMQRFGNTLFSEPAKIEIDEPATASLHATMQDYNDEDDFANVIYLLLALLWMLFAPLLVFGLPLYLTFIYVMSSLSR